MIRHKQFIENYREDYKKYNGWSVRETEHYIFHYFDKLLKNNSLNKIIKTQERCYIIINTFLKTKPSKKIKYYIYPDEDIKEKFMGNRVYGQSVIKDNSVHIVYNKDIKVIGAHEDVHLISLNYGLATSFFAEGLAEVITNKNKFCGVKRKDWIKSWLKKYKNIDISDFFTQKGWIDTPDDESGEFYTLSMYFVKFLIKEFAGNNMFLKFYKSIDRGMTREQIIKKIEHFCNKDWDVIKNNWEKFISQKL